MRALSSVVRVVLPTVLDDCAHMEHGTLLDPLTFGPDQPCFGGGPKHPIGFHLHFSREPNLVVTRFTPGTQFQGPPGIMHGGLVMTLADELAAWTVIGLLGKFGFTAAVQSRLSRPTRVGIEVIGRGQITRGDSRLAKVDVTLEQNGAEPFQVTFHICRAHATRRGTTSRSIHPRRMETVLSLMNSVGGYARSRRARRRAGCTHARSPTSLSTTAHVVPRGEAIQCKARLAAVDRLDELSAVTDERDSMHTVSI